VTGETTARDGAGASRASLAADGSDAIFITGAPGSKWSLVAHAVSFADEINTSDVAEHRSYGTAAGATHFGNYFGPGMEYGSEFDRLGEIGKSDLVAELSRPYAEPGGIKLLKSHMFARHLDYLVETFPAARFILVYRTDEECLDWWIEAGGFGISFPDYSWYRELANMREQVAVDNSSLLDFARQHEVALRRPRSLRPLLAALELSWSPERLVERAASSGDGGGAALPTDDPEAIAAALDARAGQVKLAYFWAGRLAGAPGAS
jgi:hypothetical protein